MPNDDTVRETLLALRAELEARLERIKSNVQRGYNPDSAERAKEMEDMEVVDALGNETTEKIARIAAALRRLDAGEYGICANCGGSIQAKRLETFPYAERCINCARETGA